MILKGYVGTVYARIDRESRIDLWRTNVGGCDRYSTLDDLGRLVDPWIRKLKEEQKNVEACQS